MKEITTAQKQALEWSVVPDEVWTSRCETVELQYNDPWDCCGFGQSGLFDQDTCSLLHYLAAAMLKAENILGIETSVNLSVETNGGTDEPPRLTAIQLEDNPVYLLSGVKLSAIEEIVDEGFNWFGMTELLGGEPGFWEVTARAA